MEKHIKSEYNIGKVISENPEKGTITVHWRGYIDPVEIPYPDSRLEVVMQ